MEKSGKDIQLLERDNPDLNSCVQIIRGKHHEVKWPPLVHGKWQGFGCQHTTCSWTGCKGPQKGCRVEEPEKGTGHSTWTRRSLVRMIHSQLRPPWTHPGYRRVSDTKSVYSRKLLLNHCRREPESERREAGACFPRPLP